MRKCLVPIFCFIAIASYSCGGNTRQPATTPYSELVNDPYLRLPIESAIFNEALNKRGIDGYQRVGTFTCFLEHFCAAGPVGSDLACEGNYRGCLASPSIYRSYSPEQKSECEQRFSEINQTQRSMLVNPPFCDIPLPSTALQPIMTQSEQACAADEYCKEKGSNCASRFPCANPSQSTDKSGAQQRSFCRSVRELYVRVGIFSNTASDNCRIQMAAPTLWHDPNASTEYALTENASTGIEQIQKPAPVSSTPAPPAQSAATQAKIEEMEKAYPELLDESDLDELDF